MHAREGPNWKSIVKQLPGRTTSSVRNRWLRIEKGRKLREEGKGKNRCRACGEIMLGHICRAIRKLAAVATAEECSTRLWRGVRGELARGFWLADEQDMVVAVDLAFMSTSQDRRIPMDYMQPGDRNVLWELHPRPESDAAYHFGAGARYWTTDPRPLFCTLHLTRS